MRLAIIFLALSYITISAQYTRNDYELVKTTFTREFDRDLIKSYLTSGEEQKTLAALLSISNSADTSWIPNILPLDFNRYGDAISFTLGKLGASAKSTKYLLDKLTSSYDENLLPGIIANIGKTGSLADLEMIDSLYSRDAGYPITVFNFFTRNITSDKSKLILVELLDTNQINSSSQFDILFALYRIGPEKAGSMKYAKFAESDNIDNKLYALSCLRRLEAFPDDPGLMKSILQNEDWRVRVEGAKTTCYKKIDSIDEVKLFTSLLYDLNPNVSRSAATSIRQLRIPAKLKSDVQDLLKDLLNSRGFNVNTLGELFVSYCSLYPDNLHDKIETYDDRINPQFIHRVLTDNTDDPEWNFDYLVDQFKDADEKQLMSLVPPILALQSKLIADETYTDLILSLYSGGYAAPLALMSFGLDTVFVQRNSAMFQQLIVEQTFKFLNNPQYAESLQSFPVLAGKVSEPFKETILTTLRSSRITSVANYAGSSLDEDYIPMKKETGIFEKIWSASFKYREAVVTTNRGNFTIEFHPEYAPVSVGNLCFLAEENFYDNVIFHRVVPNFVIQTGDPSSTGWGGPGYEIISEFSWLSYKESAVGMASAGKDTEGSQWFVMHSYHPHLNGNYSLFGTVTEGKEIISRIDQDDRILDVTLVK